MNDHEKPLSLYCFTTDGEVRDRVLAETSSGSVNINDVIMHMSNHLLPFGGVGQSGMGAYHGKRTFDCFTHQKAVLIKTNYLDIPSRYPPYNGFDVQPVQKILQSTLFLDGWTPCFSHSDGLDFHFRVFCFCR